jgi:sulfide dehydrogenase [flavocytochrome c] flavoprotein chain
VTLDDGGVLAYDKLVLAPGVDSMLDRIEGLAAASTHGRILSAWNAGSETLGLRQQLMRMRDGGVVAIAVPEAPYRCPPAPYERACLIAAFLQKYKPRSKVLVLDANADVVANGALFKRAWSGLYPRHLEYRNHHRAVAVDGEMLTVKFDVQEDVRADVVNVLPPLRAGALAVRAGLANINARWCEVDFLSFESAVVGDIHVIGDSIQTAPMMPKSGHMANGHAKVAAAAIVATLSGTPVDRRPMLTNACYSFISPETAIHAASVSGYDAQARTYAPLAGAAGGPPSASRVEAGYAMEWARNIWSDTLS